MKQKLVYILPLYDPKTDTHFRHLYDMICALSEKMDVYVLVERGRKFDQGKVVGSYLLPKNKLLRFVFYIFCLFKLRFQGYNKAYVHYSYLGVITAKFCAYKIFYWHCGQSWLFSGVFNGRWLKFILHLTNYLVTGTKFMANGYSQHYNLPLDRIKVLPNWIKIIDWQQTDKNEIESIRNKISKNKDDKIVLFAHRLANRKGAHYLPDVWKYFENDPKIHFVVAGGGPLREKLTQERETMGNKNNIHILGPVANSDLSNYMHMAYVFLMPSEEEGFPRVAIESMACGLPIVGFDTGGLDEILPSEYLEYFYKIGDVDKLCRGLEELLAKDLTNWPAIAKNKAANYDLGKVSELFSETLISN